jgi:hypothetical protein
MQLHHTGSQEKSQVAVPEEQTWTDQQEPQVQEVSEEEEQGEELPECADHQPSSFERGKPQSILSLLLYKSNSLYMSFIYCCIKLYELSETVVAFITILIHLVTFLPC